MTMPNWIISIIAKFFNVSNSQLTELENALPATKALLKLFNDNQTLLTQADQLYIKSEPLVQEALKEWQTVGPALQLLITLIEKEIGKGNDHKTAVSNLYKKLGVIIK